MKTVLGHFHSLFWEVVLIPGVLQSKPLSIRSFFLFLYFGSVEQEFWLNEYCSRQKQHPMQSAVVFLSPTEAVFHSCARGEINTHPLMLLYPRSKLSTRPWQRAWRNREKPWGNTNCPVFSAERALLMRSMIVVVFPEDINKHYKLGKWESRVRKALSVLTLPECLLEYSNQFQDSKSACSSGVNQGWGAFLLSRSIT